MWGRTGPPKSTTTTTCALSVMPIGPGSSCAAIRLYQRDHRLYQLPRRSPSGTPEAYSSLEPGGAAAAPRPGTSTPFVDPLLPVPDAPVTWLPSSELPVMAARADRLGTGPDADFRADALPGLASIHVDAVGRQHVVIKSGSSPCHHLLPRSAGGGRAGQSHIRDAGPDGLVRGTAQRRSLAGILDDEAWPASRLGPSPRSRSATL